MKHLPFLVVLVLAFTGCRALSGDSGITVNGKRLSRAEVEQGNEELASMMKSARAGEPSSIDLASEPRTEIGRMFRDLMREALDLQKKNEVETADFDMDKVLAMERFTSKQGIAAARRDMDRYKAVMDKFYDDLAVITEKFSRFSAEVGGKEPESIDAVRQGNQDLKASIGEVVSSAHKLLDVAQKYGPTLSADKQNFVFATDAQFNEFVKAAETMQKKQDALNELIQRTTKERAASMQRSLDFLNKP